MAEEGNYQHDKKCPKCNKRKVYIQDAGDHFVYVCEACGETWDA